MKNLTALFQMLIGFGMIFIWVLLFLTDQIPELETEPFRIVMHITAEVITGLLLLGSGIWLLIRKHPHKVFFYLSFGCLIYTLIVSPGYYAQKGEWSTFVVFLAILIFAVALLWTSRKWFR
jgi:hypothetical protein